MKKKLLFFILLLLPTLFVKGQSLVQWELANEPYGISHDGLNAVIAKAKNHLLTYDNDTVVVKIAAGTYTIGDAIEIDSINMNASKMGRLIFQGAGKDSTNLVFNVGINSITVKKTKRIEFKDFHITRNSPTATQGTLVSTGKGYMIVDISPGFPTPLEIYTQTGGKYLSRYTNSATNPVRVRDTVTNEYYPHIAWGRTNVAYVPQLISGDRWKIFVAQGTVYPDQAPYYFQPGDYVSVLSKFDGNAFFVTGGVYDITFENIKLTHSTRIVTRGSTNKIKYKGCSILNGDPINGQTPCISASLGGVQVNQYGDPIVDDVVIEDYYAERTGDDPFALYSVTGAKLKNIEIRGDAPTRIDKDASNTCIDNLLLEDGASISFFFPDSELRLNYDSLTTEAIEEVNSYETNKVLTGCGSSSRLVSSKQPVENKLKEMTFTVNSGLLTIQSENEISNVSIYDFNGKKVLGQDVSNKKEVHIPCENLKNKALIIRVNTENNLVVKKFYIE